MYAQIQHQKDQGLKPSQVARFLDVNIKTVRKYWRMTADEFTHCLSAAAMRRNKHDPYTDVLVYWLTEHPDLSAAQIHDRLKQHYAEYRESERTLRRFLSKLRRKHGLPKPNHQERQYQAVVDPPMGQQVQVDFGFAWATTESSRKIRVYGFGAILSHSRYRYLEWRATPFTTASLCETFERCWAYFGGIPKEVVMDQDKLMVVSENNGDILLTETFEVYRQAVGFGVHLCRKSDPESKGRIEAFIKYGKYNFIPHRTFRDIDHINEECLAWLERTANANIHGITKKVPAEVYAMEREHLRPVPKKNSNAIVTRTVRKDNTIMVNSNRYSVPLGTYKAGVEVRIEIAEKNLAIYALDTGALLAEHGLVAGRGHLVINRNHQRDYTKTYDEIEEAALLRLGSHACARQFIEGVRKTNSRYFRDQIQALERLAGEATADTLLAAIQQCNEVQRYSVQKLRETLSSLQMNATPNHPTPAATVASTTEVLAATARLKHLQGQAARREIGDYTRCLKGA